MNIRRPEHLVALLGLLVATGAQAVGGHFAVDDAEILDEGRCKAEAWYSRSPGDARLVHAAGGCRAGPVELTLAADAERVAGDSATAWAMSAKWATGLADGWRLGASVEPSWQAGANPRYQGSTVRLLLSWQAWPQLALHANLGRDLVRGAGDEPRLGVAAAWQVSTHWTVVGERYRQEGGQFMRAGLKWAPSEPWQLAFSRAQRLSGPGASAWTLAVNREFEGL